MFGQMADIELGFHLAIESVAFTIESDYNSSGHTTSCRCPASVRAREHKGLMSYGAKKPKGLRGQ